VQNENDPSDRIADELRQLNEVLEKGFDDIQSDIQRLIDRTRQEGGES
jgi:hypothetical protein